MWVEAAIYVPYMSFLVLTTEKIRSSSHLLSARICMAIHSFQGIVDVLRLILETYPCPFRRSFPSGGTYLPLVTIAAPLCNEI